MTGNKVEGNTVSVVVGSNKPIKVDYRQGDTVQSILDRAGASIKQGQSASLGRRRVGDPKKTKVQPGDTIVIAGRPSNGKR